MNFLITFFVRALSVLTGEVVDNGAPFEVRLRLLPDMASWSFLDALDKQLRALGFGECFFEHNGVFWECTIRGTVNPKVLVQQLEKSENPVIKWEFSL